MQDISSISVKVREKYARIGATVVENKIRYYREYHTISQREVARRAKISSPEMSAIERGINLPNVITAIRIAKALKVTVEELWEDIE